MTVWRDRLEDLSSERDRSKGRASSTFSLPFVNNTPSCRSKRPILSLFLLRTQLTKDFLSRLHFFFFASLSSSWVLALLTLFFEMSLLLQCSLSSFHMVDRQTHTHSHAFIRTAIHSFIHSTVDALQINKPSPHNLVGRDQ